MNPFHRSLPDFSLHTNTTHKICEFAQHSTTLNAPISLHPRMFHSANVELDPSIRCPLDASSMRSVCQKPWAHVTLGHALKPFNQQLKCRHLISPVTPRTHRIPAFDSPVSAVLDAPTVYICLWPLSSPFNV